MKHFRFRHINIGIAIILILLSLVVCHPMSITDNYSIVISEDIGKSISILYAIIPYIIVFFFVTIKLSKNNRSVNDAVGLRYNKYYKATSCILIIYFIYIFWVLLIHGNSGLILDGILWDHWGIKIIRNYSMEIKYEYFYEHLDEILNLLKQEEEGPFYVQRLLNIVEELQVKEFIMETTTLGEINELVDTFILSYFDHVTTHLEELKQQQTIYEEKQKLLKSVMDCISNITNLAVFSEFLSMYVKAWHIAVNPKSFATFKFMKWVVKMTCYCYNNTR